MPSCSMAPLKERSHIRTGMRNELSRNACTPFTADLVPPGPLDSGAESSARVASDPEALTRSDTCKSSENIFDWVIVNLNEARTQEHFKLSRDYFSPSRRFPNCPSSHS